MQVITPENRHEALGALREILLLYVSLAENLGFGDSVDADIRLDPLFYVDAEMNNRGYAPLLDLDLLRTGSAIAALCILYDSWSGEWPVDNRLTQGIKQALIEMRFRHVPDVQAVMVEAFRRNEMPLDDLWFDDAVAPIYQRHVRGFFERLSKRDRTPEDVT